eukprot:jgi/Hompol1/2329/HPOL_002964-RA
MLFEGTLPKCKPNGVSLIIGKGRMCKKLYLAGETQMVDRILYQFSRRYWDCNPQSQPMYRSIDIVYGILFSIVLLNTDLHIVNVGANYSKRMPRKTFLKNTMELIDTMIEKDEKIKEEVALNADSVKKWKKEMDTILRDLYASVSNNRIIQTSIAPETPEDTDELALPSTSPKLGRDGSNWSLSSIQSTGSDFLPQEKDRAVFSNSGIMFRKKPGGASDKSSLMGILRAATESASQLTGSATDTTPNQSSEVIVIDDPRSRMAGSLMEGLLIRKHLFERGEVRAKNRRWSKLWCMIRHSQEHGVELVMYKPVMVRESDAFDDSELSEESTSREMVTAGPPTQASLSSITPPHSMVEPHSSKHLSLDPSILALSLAGRTRSDTVHSSNGRRSNIVSSNSDRRLSVDTAQNPTTASCEPRQIKLSRQDPEVFSLLHAYCSALQIAYAQSRPHVLTLKLANANEFLFQAPSAAILMEWVRCINYWAGRKSKEPMRGAISSMEYGWTWIVWERKAREADDPTLGSDDRTSPLYYFQNFMLRGNSADAGARTTADASSPPKSSNASVRSMPMTGSDGSSTVSTSTTAAAKPAVKKAKPKMKISEWFAPSGGQIVSQLSEVCF